MYQKIVRLARTLFLELFRGRKIASCRTGLFYFTLTLTIVNHVVNAPYL